MNPQTVPPATPDSDRARFYEEDAYRYSAGLTWENLMEGTPQATQRKITLAAFDLVADARPEVQCFNELLIQYPVPGQKQPGRVNPDNFVIVHPTPLGRVNSFALNEQAARPFLVLEYVSKSNTRKDYEDNFVRYEQSVRVPYYLIFYPDNAELSLFRLTGGAYQTVFPNAAGRFPIPELESEVGLLDGWVRYWFRGELLPLTAELNRQLKSAVRRADAAEGERDAERAARLAADTRAAAAEAELARALAELARLRGGNPPG